MNNFNDFEVWFVTGAQLLYGGDAVVAVDAHSNEMVNGLNESGLLPVKIVYNADTAIEFLEFTNLTTESAEEQTGAQADGSPEAETGAQSEAETGGQNPADTETGADENAADAAQTDADVRSAAAAAANSRPEVIIENEE